MSNISIQRGQAGGGWSLATTVVAGAAVMLPATADSSEKASGLVSPSSEDCALCASWGTFHLTTSSTHIFPLTPPTQPTNTVLKGRGGLPRTNPPLVPLSFSNADRSLSLPSQNVW